MAIIEVQKRTRRQVWRWRGSEIWRMGGMWKWSQGRPSCFCPFKCLLIYCLCIFRCHGYNCDFDYDNDNCQPGVCVEEENKKEEHSGRTRPPTQNKSFHMKPLAKFLRKPKPQKKQSKSKHLLIETEGN